MNPQNFSDAALAASVDYVEQLVTKNLGENEAQNARLRELVSEQIRREKVV